MAKRRLKPSYLTQKQFDFLEKWIQTDNITKSAIEAGYSEKTAHVQGSRFLNSPKAQAYLTERLAQIDAEKIADSDEILQYLTAVMRGEVKDQFDLDPSIADRTKAASELLRISVKAQPTDVNVQIIDDIPRE